MKSRYPSLTAFYEDGLRGIRRNRSGERDFGTWWKIGDFPNFRVSVVADTGEIYALCHDRNNSFVEILAVVDHVDGGPKTTLDGPIRAYEEAEKLLEGWSDICGTTDSLQWVKDRLATVVV